MRFPDWLVRRTNCSVSKCRRRRRVMDTMIEENGPSTHVQPEVSPSFRARQKLDGLLNKNMKIRMTDGRTLVGLFLCTDRDCNVILGSAQEFLKSTDMFSQGEPRVLGLAMIPGHHVVSIEVEADSLEDTQGFRPRY
ncbi:N-alpha-acetyltransferase 38, NatC auxiliary subunit [Gasterosteus aculeatus]|uniref:Sm domain-containing protein n=1 Tax=Gasterosteus aculeatus aculeatus TaxID=481459 RepID=G3Q6G8_GASAC|nr:N-alpha-acetyltransferase 38, NatC auxiliary subunit [Gasterosteus aculeatus aculeatus]